MAAGRGYSSVPGSVERCAESEKKTILAALMQARWNRRVAAEMLGISYNTLRRRIAEYGMNRETVGAAGIP